MKRWRWRPANKEQYRQHLLHQQAVLRQEQRKLEQVVVWNEAKLRDALEMHIRFLDRLAQQDGRDYRAEFTEFFLTTEREVRP